MKVVFSVEPVRYPLTGIGRYAFELAKGLEARADIDTLKLFSGARFLSGLHEPGEDAGHTLRSKVQNNRLVLELYQRIMPLWRQYRLRGHQDFVYHSPNYFLPGVFDGRTIATFHDLAAFKWPECFESAKVRYLQRSMSSTIERTDALITDSNYTRQELADFFGFPIDRIHTVPLAAGPEFRPRGREALAPFLKKYDLSYQGYSLFVGTVEPRKNIGRLLDAYGMLPKAVRERWPLILSGYSGWMSADIHDRIKKAEQQGWVRYLGYLSSSELPLLFSGARLFVFPSLYEGFGLPVLEAMQSGVPVICSDRSSLPEVVGEAAVVCNAEDTHGLVSNIGNMLVSCELRREKVELGLARARQYSWEDCVSMTCQVYKAVS